jgi:hypothetical protein
MQGLHPSSSGKSIFVMLPASIVDIASLSLRDVSNIAMHKLLFTEGDGGEYYVNNPW